MTHQQAKIKELAKKHPIPHPVKLDRYLPRLYRLKHFYEEKAPDAPINQGLMFIGFVNAIVYTIEIVQKYEELTEEIYRMSKERKQ